MPRAPCRGSSSLLATAISTSASAPITTTGCRRHGARLVTGRARDRLRPPGAGRPRDEPVRRPPGRRRARRLLVEDQVVAMPAWSGDGRGSPMRQARSRAAASTSGPCRPPAAPRSSSRRAQPSRSRRRARADGKVTFRTLEPGEQFPEKTSDSGTPQHGPAPAPARLRPAPALPADDRRHQARLRLRDGQHRRRAGLGPREPRVRHDGRWSPGSSSGCRTARCATTTTPAGSATRPSRPTRTGTCSTSSATSCGRSTGPSSSATARAGSASPTTTGSPAGASPSSPAAASTATAPPRSPGALAVEQGTSIGYTDLYPAHFHGQNLELRGVPAGVYLLVHRANPQGLLEELDYTNNAASLRIRLTWSGGTPHVETLRTCEGAPLAQGQPERGG